MSTYPPLAPIRVEMDLDLRGWAVFAGKAGKPPTLGLVLEGQPGVADHAWIWSTGDEVHAQPHYSMSTWDHFWADDQARMHATGFGGLFPFTLGDQRNLRAGFLSILDRASQVLDPTQRDAATTLRLCAARIRVIAPGGDRDLKG